MTALWGMPKTPTPPSRHIERIRLREARESIGLKQNQLAERLGINPNNISRWETEKRQVRAWQLVMLADAMGVPPAFLIEDGDGISAEERELLAFLRAYPQDANILMTTYRAMRDARKGEAA